MTKSFLPDSCLRKYPEFEDLLCLGCAPLESKYVVGDNKDTLRLCKKFALALWNATTEEELNQPTKRFDNCGFLVPDGFLDTQSTTPQYINDDWFLPSDIGGGLEGFIIAIKIPYYEIKHIEIVDGESDECFSSSSYISVRLYIVILLFFIV